MTNEKLSTGTDEDWLVHRLRWVVLPGHITRRHFHCGQISKLFYMIIFSSALTETFWEVISVPESKAYRYVDTKGEQFVRYTRYKLCRIYPAGYRIDSSNPNPQAFWNCGCQLGKNIFITLSCVLLKNEALVRLQHNLQDFIVRLNFSRYRSLGLQLMDHLLYSFSRTELSNGRTNDANIQREIQVQWKLRFCFEARRHV